MGLHRSYIRNQLDAERWTACGDKVLLLQNAQPSRRQLMWIAILDASPIAALCSHTSLELAGFRTFATEAKRYTCSSRAVRKLPNFRGSLSMNRGGSARHVGGGSAVSDGPKIPALSLTRQLGSRGRALRA